MKRKQGISLIVLVITIIVMIILAASVVLTLSNSGIINKANQAVESTNVKEIEQLASLTWAEEFMAGKRGDTLKEAVLEKLKDYTDKYTITVTDTGVTVIEAGKLNEYGFYYDTVYSDAQTAVVATKNGMIEIYQYDSEIATYWLVARVEAIYEKSKIVVNNTEIVISEDGRILTILNNPEAKLEYTDIEYHDIYYGEKYYCTDNWGYFIANTDNTFKFYDMDGETSYTVPGSQLVKSSHLIEEIINSTSIEPGSYQTKERAYYRYDISIDGKYVINADGDVFVLLKEGQKDTFTIKCEHLEKECQFEQGMTWEEWVNSSYNTVNATIDEYGYIRVACSYNSEQICNTKVELTAHIDNVIMPLEWTMFHK